MSRVYDNAQAYEIAFNYRDLERETRFLLEAVTFHRGLIPLTALFLACGTGVHVAQMQRKHVTSVSLDCSTRMVGYGRQTHNLHNRIITSYTRKDREVVMQQAQNSLNGLDNFKRFTDDSKDFWMLCDEHHAIEHINPAFREMLDIRPKVDIVGGVTD